MDLGALSTEARIGRILLAVGAALRAFGAFFFLLFVPLVSSFPAMFARQASFVFMALYGLLALLSLVGAWLAWRGFRAAGQGRLQKAATYGLVAAFVPPVGVVTLIGGLFCLLSPEARQVRAARMRTSASGPA